MTDYEPSRPNASASEPIRTASCDSPNTSPALTRRSFLVGGGATVAALMLPCLGVIDGKRAYALDPSFDAGSDNPTAQFIVLSAYEIGLSVYDVDSQGKTTRVPGAKVTIISAGDASKRLDAVTDNLGAVVFDVRDVGATVDLGPDGVRYRFEGSVTVSNGDGYRICTLTKIRVDSGTAMALPCCKIGDPSIPYFEYLSFNGWDMQYCECEVLRTGAAYNPIPITGKLHLAGTQTAEVSLWTRTTDGTQTLDGKALFTVNVDVKNGVGTFRRSDLFLKLEPPSDALLPKDRSFEVHVKAGGTPYVFPVKLVVHDSPIPFKTGNANVVPEVSFGQAGSSANIFTLPSSFPAVLRGSSLTCWVPTFPLQFYLNPLGYFFLGGGICISKEGQGIEGFKQEGFANETCKSLDQQFGELAERWNSKYDAYRNMKRGTNPGTTNKFGHQFSSKIGISFALQAYISAQCNILENPNSQKFTGVMAAIIDAYAFAHLCQQFTIGPVPFFIALNISLDTRLLSLYASCESPAGDPLKISLVPSATGAGIVATFAISPSIGLGLDGVLAVSLCGTGQISTYIGLISCETTLSSPRHVVVSASLSLDLVLQAFIFKWSGNIWSEDWPRLYDNWKTDSNDAIEGTSEAPCLTHLALGVDGDGKGIYSNEEPAALAAAAANGDGSVSLAEFGKLASIVTSAELLQTKESAATAIAGFQAAPAAEPVQIAGGLFATPMNVVGPDAEDALSEGADGYLYEDAGEDPEGACDGIADVNGIADAGGVLPTKDVKIVSKSFSNPREKVVVYDGVTILFRLASVDYEVDGAHVGRSRLIAQIYNGQTGRWGRPKVLDIPVTLDGVDRADMFDCDFDVSTQTDPNPSSHLYQGIYVSLVSTLRKDGDATSFFSATCAPILTVAVFNRDLRRLSSVMWRDDPGAATANAYAITCPRVTTILRDGKPFYIAMAYLRHAADSEESVFGASAHTTCCIAVPMAANLVHASSIEVDPMTSSLTIEGIDAAPAQTDDDAQSAAFSLYFTAGGALSITTVTLTMKAQLANSTSHEDELEALKAAAVEFSFVNNINGVEDVTGMQPWPGRSSFLILSEGDLTECSFDPAVENGTLATRIVGPSRAKLSAFRISDNGNVLFFTENKEGKSAQGFDDAGEPTDAQTETRHRIMASIYVDGLFSEPFVLGQTAHALDSIAGVSGHSSYTFVTSSITDMANSMADMYYVDIPIVATATVLGFAAESVFTLQGEDASFTLVLRNDGNVILTGCRATLIDADTGEEADSVMLSFASENLCASAWNPELFDNATDEDIAAAQAYTDEAVTAALGEAGIEGAHPLADPAAAGVLIPGKTAQYRVTFTIPSNWHGTKNAYAALSQFSYETVVSAAPDDVEVSPLDHQAPHDDLPRTELAVHASNEPFDPGLSAPTIGIVADDGNETPSDGGEDGAGTLAGLATTGDGTGLGMLGLAAGAAAAAFTAYSARRTALARERKDAPDDRP